MTLDIVSECTVGHTHYRLTEAGLARLQKYPHGLPMPKRPGRAKLTPPSPPRSADWLAPLTASIQARAARGNEPFKSQLGKTVGRYAIQTTDGYRAIRRESGDATDTTLPTLERQIQACEAPDTPYFTMTPAFYKALVRMRILADTGHQAVTLQWAGEADDPRVVLTMAADGYEAAESIDASGSETGLSWWRIHSRIHVEIDILKSLYVAGAQLRLTPELIMMVPALGTERAIAVTATRPS